MDLVHTEYTDVFRSLQQGDFAALIFWFYIIAGIIVASCMLELVYRCDRKFFPLVVLFPVTIIIVIILRFERYRALCFFLVSYILLLLITDSLTAGETGYNILALLRVIGFWPIYFSGVLLKKINSIPFFHKFIY